MFNVSLNGQQAKITSNKLSEVMHEWQYVEENFAVAINGEFIPRSLYAETRLNNGDEIDVVGAVGGG